jgi:hypothetical protein
LHVAAHVHGDLEQLETLGVGVARPHEPLPMGLEVY